MCSAPDVPVTHQPGLFENGVEELLDRLVAIRQRALVDLWSERGRRQARVSEHVNGNASPFPQNPSQDVCRVDGGVATLDHSLVRVSKHIQHAVC